MPANDTRPQVFADGPVENDQPLTGQQPQGESSAEPALSDEELVRETFGNEARQPATLDDDPADAPEPPRSFFRSLGRALQQGATDAAGFTSGNNEDSPELDPADQP